MNDSKYGLTASLWTRDTDRATRLGREIETGTVFMNRADYLDPALCWTGVKETGRGGSLSVIGFHNLTRPKSYHLRKVTGMTITANWSYPTAIKFGAGRIKELADHCKAVGIKKPLLVTDRGLAPMAITQNALDIIDAAGLGRAIFADVDPNPNDKNLRCRRRLPSSTAAMMALLPLAADPASISASASPSWPVRSRPVWDFEDIGDWWTRAKAEGIAPIIAVPTTAGTGSEVGRATVITHLRDACQERSSSTRNSCLA